MLIRLVKESFYQFSRSSKPKRPTLPPDLRLKTKKNPSSISHPLSLQQQSQEQDQINQEDTPINRQLRQKNKALEKNIDQMIHSGMNEDEIIKNVLNQNLKLIKPESVTNNEEGELEVLKQELMLSEIMKQNKKNRNRKQLPLGSKYQEQLEDEQDKFLKREKIMRMIQNKTDLTKVNLNEINAENKLKESYSDFLIKKADEYRQNQLSYFKQLLGEKEDQLPKSSNFMGRRIKKWESYVEVKEKEKQEKEMDKLARQEQKKELEIRREEEKIMKQFERAQIDRNRNPSNLMVTFEDQNYYKDKALREFNTLQIQDPQVNMISEVGEKDMDESADLRGIMLEEYDELEYGDPGYQKQMYLTSSFGKIDAKMKDIIGRLQKQGISFDMQEFSGMNRDLLFEEKQDREKEMAYQRYLIKKKKKKDMKQVIKKIHKEKLRDDLDFNIDFKNRLKDVNYDPLDIQANLEKIRLQQLERQASVQSSQNRRSEIHFMKTEKNIERFIRSYFYEKLCNPNTDYGYEISIDDIKYNEKKTVVHIFWSYAEKVDASLFKEAKERTQEHLESSSNYISGKMTQLFGFRYGPDIRFYFNEILSTTEQVKMELARNKEQVVEFQINSLKKKGHIKDEETQKQFRQKLLAVAQQNIQNYHNRNLLLNKDYQKKIKNKNTKKSSSSPNAIKAPRKVKMGSEQKLWNEIDKL